MLMRSAPAQPAMLKTRNLSDLTAAAAATAAQSNSTGASGSGRPAVALAASRVETVDGEMVRSVIGHDLFIIGQGLRIVSSGALQIDGQIQGDVQGADVVVGVTGRVTGTVAGETVVVRGAVEGVVRGRQVTLEAHSKVEGDIHHQALSILPGAEFDGRSRRTRPGETFDLANAGPDGDQPKPGSLS